MKDQDKPAFPTTKREHDCQLNSSDVHGLTKREYFAAMAMQGILSNPTWALNDAFAARAAIQEADHLLKHLEL